MSRSTPSAQPPTGPGHSGHDADREAWAASGTVFAAILLLVGGVLAVLEGIVGIAKDSVYVITRGGSAYNFNVTAWGWIHLVLGVIAAFIGMGLLLGVPLARFAGIGIASIQIIANFIFLPYQPVWSVIMIAIDLFVIWSLASYHPHRSHQQGGMR
ncbi:DUF7144 family membrane protein [Streptomyces sp. NBC_01198]|uniref:DUF7144 family membrane protein n=1 Tax=Streptomyces sp. NBC_01198 TaxID=2903769 RepID=UPI002E0E4355|nr:hypothetical protein OG702_21725 [Streptomyces sp. NBC_01198]